MKHKYTRDSTHYLGDISGEISTPRNTNPLMKDKNVKSDRFNTQEQGHFLTFYRLKTKALITNFLYMLHRKVKSRCNHWYNLI